MSDQGPCHAQPRCSRLTAHTAALHVDQHVNVAEHLDGLQRNANLRALAFRDKVGVHRAAVHLDFPIARTQEDPGHAGLAPSRAVGAHGPNRFRLLRLGLFRYVFYYGFYDRAFGNGYTSGFCASWGCLSSAYTTNFRPMPFPSSFLGSIPRTASRITASRFR